MSIQSLALYSEEEFACTNGSRIDRISLSLSRGVEVSLSVNPVGDLAQRKLHPISFKLQDATATSSNGTGPLFSI
jgi:hypothetical protein